MAITRANTEAILIKRVGNLMTACGLNGTTVDGTNADLNDPIGYGIRQVDGTVASIILVTDADVATVSSDDYDQFFDTAEYRVLQSCWGNLASFDIKIGPRDEKRSQLANRLQAMIDKKRQLLDMQYGAFVASFSVGTLDLNFAEHNEDNLDELGR